MKTRCWVEEAQHLSLGLKSLNALPWFASPAWQGKMTMTKMWSGGVEYNLTGQGFDPTKGAIFRAGAVMPPGVNSNRELGVRSTLLSALLCSDTQLFCAEEAPGSPVGLEQ